MIIAFCGQAGNGKDTAGEITIELAKSEGIRLKRIAFADSMKRMAAKSLGYDSIDQSYIDCDNEIEFMNALKDEFITDFPYTYQTPYYPSDLTNVHTGTMVRTGREFLIDFGQSVKEHLGGNFWAKLAFSEIAPWPDIVVTDLRFEEEAEYVRNLGGYIIHLYREEDQEDGELAGEQKLPAHLIDFELDNTKDIPYLKSNIQNILNEILYEDEEEKYDDVHYLNHPGNYGSDWD